MIPDGAVGQFANTWREWHYFAGGFAIGWAAGLVVGLTLRR